MVERRAPRVTIGLPVFNGERYLDKTMESLLSQDYGDYEILVADNASTDATVQIVEEWAQRDPRVRLLRGSRNMGAAYNYNRLVYESNAELFKWAGYDDLLEPSYLSRCVAALDSDHGAVLAFPGTTIMDGDGASVREYPERLNLDDPRAWRRVASFAWRVSLCNACFGLMRRDTMLTTGLIRPYISSDVTFLAEMAARGTFVKLRERLFWRRVHDGSSRQGRTSLAEVSRWFDSSAARTPRAPRLRLLTATVGALAGSGSSGGDRFGSATAFACAYSVRRLRIQVGRAKAMISGHDLQSPELIYHLRGADS